MILKDLLDQLLGEETVQISWDKDNWEEFDSIRASSPLLKLLSRKEIKSLSAIEEDVFRVSMKSDEVEE